MAAAAGNRGVEELLAPAQTPTVLTVGGVDDRNRALAFDDRRRPGSTELYHHNYGTVPWEHSLLRKPETAGAGTLAAFPDPAAQPAFCARRIVDRPAAPRPASRQKTEAMMPEVWHALRRRMNAHKWVHPYYQHVDGTSVAVAQVSAVAAQMFAANPALTGRRGAPDPRRQCAAAAHLLPRQTGAGLLQPAAAVAAALRAPGGRLAGFPRSGVRMREHELREHELHKWAAQGTLAVLTLNEPPSATGIVYFGCYAPQADCVSLVGSFNDWLPYRLPLQPASSGWWHAAVQLPQGQHLYRFWLESGSGASTAGTWQRDPENPNRSESGYHDGHSVVIIE